MLLTTLAVTSLSLEVERPARSVECQLRKRANFSVHWPLAWERDQGETTLSRLILIRVGRVGFAEHCHAFWLVACTLVAFPYVCRG